MTPVDWAPNDTFLQRTVNTFGFNFRDHYVYLPLRFIPPVFNDYADTLLKLFSESINKLVQFVFFPLPVLEKVSLPRLLTSYYAESVRAGLPEFLTKLRTWRSLSVLSVDIKHFRIEEGNSFCFFLGYVTCTFID